MITGGLGGSEIRGGRESPVPGVGRGAGIASRTAAIDLAAAHPGHHGGGDGGGSFKLGGFVHIPPQQIGGGAQGAAEQQGRRADLETMTEVRMADVARLGPLGRGDINGHGSWFFFHGIFGGLIRLAGIEIIDEPWVPHQLPELASNLAGSRAATSKPSLSFDTGGR